LLCSFAEKPMCFLVLQVCPSAVYRSLQLGPFLYGLDPRLPGYNTQGPDLKFCTVDLLFL
jgi:hypothetical protein